MAYEEINGAEWIPISVQLPHKNGDYLVTYTEYDYVTILYFLDGKWIYDYTGEYEQERDNIMAWMPLPKPYKENEE